METKKQAPITLIIFSALIFIPMIGVVFGIISIIIGLVNFTRFKLLFILGASGIGFTILIYGSLYLFEHGMEKNGKIDEMKAQTTEMFLNNLSNELQNYKCKYGNYPDSLGVILRLNSLIVINDMFNKNNAKSKFDKGLSNRKSSCNYFYKLNKDSFILFSVGKDGKPFTKDDILPHGKKIKPIWK